MRRLDSATNISMRLQILFSVDVVKISKQRIEAFRYRPKAGRFFWTRFKDTKFDSATNIFMKLQILFSVKGGIFKQWFGYRPIPGRFFWNTFLR